MSDVKWTASQREAIEARGANILINAAAGSGKTAVLTERIVRRLLPQNGEEPIPADRLLVVTFTRAAASEMRQRIEKGLKSMAAAAETPERRKLALRQIRRLAAAKITTIDSFCQSVVKEYFHVLGIDPVFSILDKTEAEPIWDEVFEQMCAELYAGRDKGFYMLLGRYCKNGDEYSLKSMVYGLYGFTRTLPCPERFIIDAAEDYNRDDITESAWYRGVEKSFLRLCKRTLDKCGKVIGAVPADGLWSGVRAVAESDSELVRGVMEAGAEKGSQMLAEGKFQTMRMPKEGDEEVKKAIKSARDSMKRSYEKIKDITPENELCVKLMKNNIYPAARELSRLTLMFSEKLEQSKRERGVFEFYDIEQLCYRLFAENEEIRRDFTARFDEILIDEYQDTNSLQDELFAMISRGDNLFMVGDMKQSIYRFRSSDPIIFREKADSYQTGAAAKNRRINLSENFRSRAEVLSAVNDLFDAAMSIDVGELEYDESQRLNLGNDGYENNGCDYRAECVVVENAAEDEETPERVRCEAEYIAAKILRMKRGGFLVRDKIKVRADNGEITEIDGSRPLKNSDIVILMSSYKTAADVYSEVFGQYGIKLSCTVEGYFIRPEIKLMMSLLRIVENPNNDIAMLSALRSPVGGFSDEELAKIRISEKKEHFYDALFSVYSKYLAKKDELSRQAQAFGIKTQEFCERLLEWRDMARYMNAERLVRTICEQSGLYAFFSAASGNEATANLRLFFDRAKSYESSGFRGLFAFLRHMERLEQNSADLEAADLGTDTDSVRLMTIHKSKGLGMPVVFVAGCGRRFNPKSAQGSFLIHKELGMALSYTSYEEGVYINAPAHDAIAGVLMSELMSEEMRKLYVAMTRAKEKLIVVSSIDSGTLAVRERGWKSVGLSGLRQNAEFAYGFADWVAPAAMESDNWIYTVERCESAAEAAATEEKPEFHAPACAGIIDYTYPYAAERMKSKSAVSDFKNVSHDVTLAAKPAFMSAESGITGTEYGNAVHRIMETLPPERGCDEEYVQKHITSLAETGDIRSELLKSLSAEKFVKFYSSSIGRRIAAADRVYRESEFEIGIDAAKLYNDAALEGETALLQGIIDCWFYEGDGIVLVDYKTDRVADIDEIRQMYDIQLALYAEALEKITKKKVKDKFIYLFSRDIVVQC